MSTKPRKTTTKSAPGTAGTPASAAAPRQVIAPVLSGNGARAGMVGPRTVGSFVPRLTKQAFERYGFAAATLITDWASIVGADLARWTQPERLKWPKGVAVRGDVEDADQGRPGATLVLRVDGGRALDIQYKGRQIVERINAYFGYRAVAELRILQAPIDEPSSRGVKPRPPVRAATPLPREALAQVNGVADAGLRAALERMASGLASRRAAAAAPTDRLPGRR